MAAFAALVAAPSWADAAQEAAGDWVGVLEVAPGTRLPLIFGAARLFGLRIEEIFHDQDPWSAIG